MEDDAFALLNNMMQQEMFEVLLRIHVPLAQMCMHIAMLLQAGQGRARFEIGRAVAVVVCTGEADSHQELPQVAAAAGGWDGAYLL